MPSGTRWVLTPFWGPKHRAFKAEIEYGTVVYGAVAAFKVQDRAGKPVLNAVWVSRDMYMADPPVIANGIVFAYGSGESTTQRWPEPGHVGGAAGRIQESTHAIVYALDAHHGQGAVVERRSDRVVESLQRPVRRERPCLHRHLRRRALLLWRGESACRHDHDLAARAAMTDPS